LRALLLAAGLGTRLRPITDAVPKCLVPIRGRPLLDIWLDLLLSGDAVERVLINVFHLAGMVAAHVAASPWRERIDLVDEAALLGTGGTVLANRSYFGAAAFIVAHADNLTRFDLTAFIGCHEKRPVGCDITMMTFDTDAPQSCGIVEEDGCGIVRAFHEKVANPPGTRANGAVYIFEPSVIDFIGAIGHSTVDISTEVLPAYLGRMVTFHNAGYHRDIGTLRSLQLAEAEL
jgi:mannose-1-phosphate guanylyltransferase